MADHSDDLDLDQLIDSASDDFQNLNLSKPSLERSKEAVETKREPPSLPSGVQGLGMGLPDLRTKNKGKQKVSGGFHVTEALDKQFEELAGVALDDLRNLNLSQPSLQREDRINQLKKLVKQMQKLVESRELAIKRENAERTEAFKALKTMREQKFQREYAECTEAIKALKTMREQSSGKLAELTEADKGLETMTEHSRLQQGFLRPVFISVCDIKLLATTLGK